MKKCAMILAAAAVLSGCSLYRGITGAGSYNGPYADLAECMWLSEPKPAATLLNLARTVDMANERHVTLYQAMVRTSLENYEDHGCVTAEAGGAVDPEDFATALERRKPAGLTFDGEPLVL